MYVDWSIVSCSVSSSGILPPMIVFSDMLTFVRSIAKSDDNVNCDPGIGAAPVWGSLSVCYGVSCPMDGSLCVIATKPQVE